MIRQQVIRFIGVGFVNTVIDIAIYTILRNLGLVFILANIISTSIALCFSFTFNRSFTFKAHAGKANDQFIKFIPITLCGLWLIQPIVIYFASSLNNVLHYSTHLPFAAQNKILIPKLCATAVSLVWNYFWYKNYVFSTKRDF